jgi:hypothetical protein
MTQDEIEAEFHSLREQIFKLQQQREDQKNIGFAGESPPSVSA